MGKAKKILKIVGNTLLWLFVAFAVLVTVLVFSSQNQDGLPNIMGKSLIYVQSDSMKGVFETGDMIVDSTLTTEERMSCKVGEIITYYFDRDGDGIEETFNTHRIVGIEKEDGYTYYITRGDNHEISTGDERVNNTKVVGKYTGTKIPVVGRVINFLQKPTGFMCVIVIPLVLFFLFELYRFISMIVRSRAKSEISAEDEEEIKKKAIEEYLRQQAETGTTPENPDVEVSDRTGE